MSSDTRCVAPRVRACVRMCAQIARDPETRNVFFDVTLHDILFLSFSYTEILLSVGVCSSRKLEEENQNVSNYSAAPLLCVSFSDMTIRATILIA